MSGSSDEVHREPALAGTRRGTDRLRHIVFVTGNYPSAEHPSSGMFVAQLVRSMAAMGVRCTVIHPRPIHEVPGALRGRSLQGQPEAGGVVIVRPWMLSVSNKRIGRFSTASLTNLAFRRAVQRALLGLGDEPPDAVYGHFLYSAGAAAVMAGVRIGRPRFVAVGESFSREQPGLWTLRGVDRVEAARVFAQASGFVAVSSLLKRQLIADLGVPEEKIRVFPNGVDLDRFRPMDRIEMRRKHSLPMDAFLVVFVGAFDERKGVARVCEAIRGMPNTGGVFIGEGPIEPRGDQVIYRGRVPHEDVAELLAACDAFVLPSQAEGSSNATLEAMACGLPVVVSAGDFNDDLVSQDVAMRVDPMDVEAIRVAIGRLRTAPERREWMGKAARERALSFDLRARAMGILAWMNAVATGESAEERE